MAKDDGAFLTIGELARQLGVAQHILRYWETRFSQLRPVQRSGNRRYYRPADVEIARQINRLLNEEGFTVRGAQRALRGQKATAPELVEAPVPPEVAPEAPLPEPAATVVQGELPIGPASPPLGAPRPENTAGGSDLALLIARLTVIRQTLVDALEPG